MGTPQSPLWKVEQICLKKVVAESRTFSEILAKFNLTNGCVIRTLRKVLESRQINFNHLKQGRKNLHKEKYERQAESYIQRWKEGKEKGWTGKSYKVVETIRRYLFTKYHDKCQKCKWSEVNTSTGKVPLQVDHIDGNPANCQESNLALLCPNCHSLTSTFGRLNQKSCRTHR